MQTPVAECELHIEQADEDESAQAPPSVLGHALSRQSSNALKSPSAIDVESE
jgi:hypothetical protein